MEKITRARVKDCFKGEDNETVYFIIEMGQLGKALGKGAVNIKKIQDQINKKIRLIEYHPEVIAFVKNVIYPLKVEEIVQEDGDILIKDNNKKTKSLLIGRDGKNLRLTNRAVKRFFSVNDVKVV